MVAAGLASGTREDGGSLMGQEDEVLEAVRMCVELGTTSTPLTTMARRLCTGPPSGVVNPVAQYLVDKGAALDARDTRGWTALAVANGLTYTDFFKQQPQTARSLQRLMQARGCPPRGRLWTQGLSGLPADRTDQPGRSWNATGA